MTPDDSSTTLAESTTSDMTLAAGFDTDDAPPSPTRCAELYRMKHDSALHTPLVEQEKTEGQTSWCTEWNSESVFARCMRSPMTFQSYWLPEALELHVKTRATNQSLLRVGLLIHSSLTFMHTPFLCVIILMRVSDTAVRHQFFFLFDASFLPDAESSAHGTQSIR